MTDIVDESFDVSVDAEDGLDLLLDALAPTRQRIQDIVSPNSSYSDAQKRTLVTRAFFQAASNNQTDLLEYLLCDPSARACFDVEAVDQEGSPAMVLAAFTGLGEVVRLLLENGADVNARDARGWTALMWAFQTNNFPLSSFLINRRASTTIRSHNGLSAIDLVRKGPAGDVFRSVLQDFEDQEEASRSLNNDTHSVKSLQRQPCRRASVVSLPASPSMRSNRLAKHTSMPATPSQAQLWHEKEQQMRTELAMESAQNLQLDFSLLDISPAGAAGEMPGIVEASEEGEMHAGESEDGVEPLPPFDWEECKTDQMLAFSLQDLPAILDLATDVKPSRTNDIRFMPANIVFLAARYASRYGGEDLLGELMIGAIDRIEASIHQHAEDLANSAFWLSNTILLLYYLRRDPHTAENTLEYQDNLHDLIREIFVFCIRDTERRLDKILDASILEHEALPGFEDIRFEGEWRFVKALTSRAKKESSTGFSPSSRPSVMGLFGSPDKASQASGSPQNTPPSKLISARSRTPSMPIIRAGSPQTTPAPINTEFSPRSVTSILSSTLFILQHYDYAGHPCIVVQAFSQLLYWMASELFNRILAKKRYICRSRAIQIRLSVSSLEDWARTNRLPTQMVNAHFRPLNELLQWLQCLSSETSIDGLLSTMQNMRTLNPMQMRKAVKDYRYEVEETKMSEECSQYLAQLQKDWERRRLLQGIEEAELNARQSFSSSASSSISEHSLQSISSESERSHESSRTSDPRTKTERHIDEIFGLPDKVNYHSYEPPERPECSAELLDSRAMLPFALPTFNEALTEYQREAFGPLHRSPVPNAGLSSRASTPILRSTSLQSQGSAQSSGSTFGTQMSIEPSLPDDFLSMLKEAKSRYYTEDVPSLFVPARHERNASQASASGLERDDHWVNWRERMEQEQAEAEAEDELEETASNSS